MSVSLERQRQWWNRFDNDFFEGEKLGPEDRERGDLVLSFLRSLKLANPSILEVGCANGWFATRLAECGRVTGTDLADAAVEKARVTCPSGKFVAGDFLSMSFPEKYDIAVTMETMAHVADQAAFCARLREVLKPGGHLVMTTQNRFVYDRKRPGIFKQMVNESPDAVLARYATIREVKALLSPHFAIKRLTTLHPHGNRGILRPINSPKLNRLASLAIPKRWLTSLKQACGLGQTIVVLASAQ
jgi:2-polyprenyl-3-methyl-5-hydroxy-6-metoxy-1,4-benzoquinol methylase